MTTIIQSLFLPSDPKKYWLQTLLLLGVILCIVIFVNRINLKPYSEGFSQDPQFVLKRGDQIYDDLYVQIYDQLMKPEDRVGFEIDQIIDMTQSSKKRDVFLDIGSGTGHLVNNLNARGYTAYGIEKSTQMIEYSEKKFPDISVKCGDVHEPMTYERNTFSHIICTNFTVYQFADKNVFFRNCFHWLIPSGYLILHLVDRQKFDTIIPAGKPPLFNSPQKYAKKRITDTIIDFIDFQYKASYQFLDNKQTVLKETFTDTATNKVRQNELTLYMEDIDDILRIAKKCGFIIHGQFNLETAIGDEFQYIYMLERPV